MQIKRKCSVCLVLAMTCSARATTIVAVIYRDAIYFAADSKISYTGNPPQNVQKTVCKIGHTTKMAFACAAPVTNDLGFNLIKMIADLLSPQKTLKEWMSQSDEAIRANLPLVLDRIKSASPKFYASRLGYIIADCAFASWDSPEPALFDDVWLLDRNGTLQHEAWNQLVATGKNSVVIGERAAIEKRLGGGPPLIGKLGIPGMLESLIRLQIEAAESSPDPFLGPTVGPPISILRLDGAGAYWEMPGVCEK
jgi:hypothetical protein